MKTPSTTDSTDDRRNSPGEERAGNGMEIALGVRYKKGL
jgi:hypothetical protein